MNSQSKKNKRKKKKVYVFSCGTQYADWIFNNCETCKKGYDYENDEYRCDIQKELDFAYISDGMIDYEIAKRMGYFKAKKKGLYIWRCPEKEL